jgi:splicing factor 3A subunit 3
MCCQVAWKEHRVAALCDIMSGVVNATVRHAEKQQTRTAEEREAELREEEFGLPQDAAGAGASGKKRAGGEEDEDDDAPVYNPLNLPLGWDGKPIPYWMYKLHGLGVEYKCQICGDASYWGRRAFDRHFQEWKHAHGMRSLGIPNTKHFHDITLIDDAVALYSKIKAEIQVGQFQGDMEEEFEDTHGNILNRRTYEDLARQGLL